MSVHRVRRGGAPRFAPGMVAAMVAAAGCYQAPAVCVGGAGECGGPGSDAKPAEDGAAPADADKSPDADPAAPDARAPFDAPPGMDCVVEIAAGEGFACARRLGGGVECWGRNDSGQLGSGMLGDQDQPVPTLVGHATQLAAGQKFACVLRDDRTVWCWGANNYKQIDPGMPDNYTTPVRAPGPGMVGVDSIGLGQEHACAVLSGGSLACWGHNDDGQLGGGTSTSTGPILVGLTSVAQVDGGENHTCARTSGGTVTCWGSNAQGQIGQGTAMLSYPTPVDVDVIAGAISLGGRHSCAWSAGGGAVCWGNNAEGAVGAGDFYDASAPRAVMGLTTRSLGAAGWHSCAVDATGRAVCWGKNDHSQLGDGTMSNRNVLVPVATLIGDARQVVGGDDFTCALLQDGAVRCWGYNDNGQLGDGSRASSPAPVPVAMPACR